MVLLILIAFIFKNLMKWYFKLILFDLLQFMYSFIEEALQCEAITCIQKKNILTYEPRHVCLTLDGKKGKK